MKGRTFWILVLAVLAGGGVLGWQAYQDRLNAFRPDLPLAMGGSNRSRWT